MTDWRCPICRRAFSGRREENRRVRGIAGPGAGDIASRRRALAGLLATAGTLVGRLLQQFQPAQYLHLADAAAAERASAARRDHRNRRGQGRPHPAAVGGRQCRPCRPGHAQRGRDGACRVQFARTSSFWSRTTAAPPRRRAHGAQQALDEGAEIILGPLFAQSVSVVGQVARAAQYPGHRLFDRRQCRFGGRLSVELPAGIGRRAHRAIRSLDRETFVSPR